MDCHYDVAIVGAGPAGTICALALLRAGLRPLLIEKTQFPRYHIGESLTGRAAVELRRLGLGPHLDAQGFPIKYGVKVYGTNGANAFWVPVQQVHTASNYSYQVEEFTGKGYLCVDDAHRFIDPIFSFGVNSAILEGLFAAQAICRQLDVPNSAQEAPFLAYQTRVNRGQDLAQDLIDCFWEHPLPFLIISQYQYQDEVTKLFGGNLYDDDVEQWGGVRAIRELLYSAAE